MRLLNSLDSQRDGQEMKSVPAANRSFFFCRTYLPLLCWLLWVGLPIVAQECLSTNRNMSSPSAQDINGENDASSQLTNDLVKEILSHGLYATEEEEEICNRLVSELSTSEIETAARTSYAYWWYVNQPKQEDDNDLLLLRLAAARKEARRHFVGSQRNYNRALESLRYSLALRQEYNVDLLRWLAPPANLLPALEDSDSERLERYRSYITDEMERQPTAVVGIDEEQRAIILKGTRSNSETHVEGYLIMQIYVAERAMAVTEIASVGRQEQTFCLFDFAGYISQNAPATSALRFTVTKLQSLYKERLYKLIILDPPLLIRGLFNIITPFLDPITRAKVDLAIGEEGRKDIVNVSPSRQQALAQLLLNSTGDVEYRVCLDTFLHRTLFHEHYELAGPIMVTT